MPKDYKDVLDHTSSAIGKLRKEIPEVMQGFAMVSQAATKDGALDKKTKELLAVGMSVAARCDGCIGMHVSSLARLKASREELLETLGMAIYMGGGPSIVYAAEALKAFDDLSQ